MPAKNAPGLTATSPGFLTPIHDTTFPFVPFYDETPVEPPKPKCEVVLKGAAIAAIKDSDGITTKLVIFRPTKRTLEHARMYEDCYQDLVIEDANGRFTPQRAQVIVDHVYEPATDTLVVTTENQE